MAAYELTDGVPDRLKKPARKAGVKGGSSKFSSNNAADLNVPEIKERARP